MHISCCIRLAPVIAFLAIYWDVLLNPAGAGQDRGSKETRKPRFLKQRRSVSRALATVWRTFLILLQLMRAPEAPAVTHQPWWKCPGSRRWIIQSVCPINDTVTFHVDLLPKTQFKDDSGLNMLLKKKIINLTSKSVCNYCIYFCAFPLIANSLKWISFS